MNKELLEDFVKYCKANPDMRFWQALRNWSEFNFIYASNNLVLSLVKYDPETKQVGEAGGSGSLRDTFYWTNKNG